MAKFLRSVEVIVMTDIQRAMLGDHEAAARLTEQGVLIPCPWCKGSVRMQNVRLIGRRLETDFVCEKCCKAQTFGQYIVDGENEFENPSALSQWNTRAPILSESELKKLRGDGC